jgi:hypothetical protein
MHVSRFLIASATILVSVAAFGQAATDTVYQVHYFSNLPTLDTVVNITDTGASIGTQFAVNAGSPIAGTCNPQNPCSTSGAAASTVGNGNLCINAYIYNPSEELQSCCTCFVTPNGLWSWDVLADFDTAPTPLEGPQASGVIKLVATLAGPTAGTSGCDATLAGQPAGTPNFLTGAPNAATNSVLAPGMQAWSRGQLIPGLAAVPALGTETGFAPSTLTTGELKRLTTQCASMISPPIGVCKACRLGGL